MQNYKTISLATFKGLVKNSFATEYIHLKILLRLMLMQQNAIDIIKVIYLYNASRYSICRANSVATVWP